MLDCLATDFFRDKAYPTYLLYNPYRKDKMVRIDVGDKPVDLYDAVAHAFVVRGACGQTPLRLAADQAAVVVLVPTGGTVARNGSKLLVNGVVVDYQARVTRHGTVFECAAIRCRIPENTMKTLKAQERYS